MRVSWPLAALIFPLLLPASELPQASSVPAKDTNLYLLALDASIQKMSHSEGFRPQDRQIVVLTAPGITGDLPTEIRGHQIEYLDDQGLIDRFKSLKKEFEVLRIDPMQNDTAHLVISVDVSFVDYIKGDLLILPEGWIGVEFSFDCKTQSFIITKVGAVGI